MQLRVMVVDDEEHICSDLIYILEQFPGLTVVGYYLDGDSGLEAIKLYKPDLVFLDIEMPGLNGLEVGQYFVNREGYKPAIIYVTAYDNHALKAFQVDAYGYILKPFCHNDVKRVLDKINMLGSSNQSLTKAIQGMIKTQVISPPLKKLKGELGGRLYLIDYQDINYIYAKDRRVFIHGMGKEYSCQYSLQEVEGILDNQIFFRCHRNYLINLQRVREIIPWFNGSYLLILEGSTAQIPVARTKVKLLKEIFHL